MAFESVSATDDLGFDPEKLKAGHLAGATRLKKEGNSSTSR